MQDGGPLTTPAACPLARMSPTSPVPKQPESQPLGDRCFADIDEGSPPECGVELPKPSDQPSASEIDEIKQRLERIESDIQKLHRHSYYGSASPGSGSQKTKGSSIGEIMVELQGAKKDKIIQEDDDWVKWNRSVWELGMLIGFKDLGVLGSLFSAILLGINIGMQLLLCFIINDTFTAKNIDESTVAEMKRWRFLSGHDWNFVDSQSFQPLAHRICSFDSSLPLSTAVANTLGEIDQYLGDHSNPNVEPLLGFWLPRKSVPVGELLCVLAIIIWLLHCTVGVKAWHGLMKGVLHVPVAPKTKVEPCGEDGDQWKIESFTKARFSWCIFLQLAQLIIMLLLGFSGVLYLSFTINLGDLLLNAAALKLVFDLDELLYEALCPNHVHRYFGRLVALERSATATYRGMNARPCGFFTALIVIIVLICSTLLRSQSEDLRRAREEICGGETNFVKIVDPAGMVYAAKVPFDQPLFEKSFEYQSMQQLIEDKSGRIVEAWFGNELGELGMSKSANVNQMKGSFWSMEGVKSMNAEDVMGVWNPKCEDMIPKTDHNANDTNKDVGTVSASNNTQNIRRSWLHILRDAFGNNNTRQALISGCDAAKDYCNYDSIEGLRTRQLCPVTCGCVDPGARLVMGGKQTGCPAECAHKVEYKQQMQKHTCKDTPVNSAFWSSYLAGIAGLRASYPPSWHLELDKLSKQFETNGCEVVRRRLNPLWINMCEYSRTWFLKSTAFGCPEACNCSTSLTPSNDCPPVCVHR